jgi:putative DNA primase/helicase
VLNGTLNLRTGELRPHLREDFITRLAPTTYDAAALCPTWEHYLDRVFGGQQPLITFMRRLSGYCLTGRTVERILAALHGPGANGKTTYMEALGGLLGDYAMRVPATTLLAKRDSGIPNDIARLKGARFVWTSETEEGRRLAEALVKEVTGGDTLTARFMRGEWFDFLPEFKVWLATNHKPIIRGTDHAVWDRIRLIPFSVRIPESERDKDLAAKLRAEYPGILAWAVRGCVEWQRDGLGTPDEVLRATDNYRAEMDVLGQFLAECCLRRADVSVTVAALYDAYVRWCKETGDPHPMRKNELTIRIQERNLAGVEQRRTHSGRCWMGLGLIDHAQTTFDGTEA